ncbi:MAG: preprotein translocase subunit SecA, partial [Glaciihabitans sp.]
DEVLTEAGARGKVTTNFLTKEILSDAKIQYGNREAKLGEPAMRELERRVVLSVIDRRWRDHLYEMDYLKDGIGLRAMAQRDPLVEYQREGFALYQSMMAQIREESVGFLFNLEVEVTSNGATAAAPIVAAKGLTGNAAPTERLSYSAPSEDNSGAVEVRNGRGQVDKASTAKAQQVQRQQNPDLTPAPAASAPAAKGSPAAKGATATKKGSFGQSAAVPTTPPANRAERRKKR